MGWNHRILAHKESRNIDAYLYESRYDSSETKVVLFITAWVYMKYLTIELKKFR